MIAVLIIEDVPVTQGQLRDLITESIDEPISVYSASNLVEVKEQLKVISKDKPAQLIAVVDAMIPALAGSPPEPAKEAVEALAEGLDPVPLLIFVSAYDEKKVEEWRAELTSEDYQPRSYFISKSAVDWGDQVVKRIKERIYGSEIEGLLSDVFGPATAQSPLAKFGRSRVFGLTHRLELLIARIRQHYADVHTDLQKRIDQHFDVNVSKDPPEVDIK